MQPSKAGSEFADLAGLPLNEHIFLPAIINAIRKKVNVPVYLTGGSARGPMNVSQSIDSANRAALKALNFLDGTIASIPLIRSCR